MKPQHALVWTLPLMTALSTAVIAQEQAVLKRDPYYQPVGAKSTSHMPRVIIRNMRQDREGHVWFATFGGPIRYDGNEFTEKR